MRWSTFAIIAAVFIVLDRSFMAVFTMPTLGSIAPNVAICLVVFITLFASRYAAMGAALILGLTMDLTETVTQPPLHIIGPNALGYLFASYLVLQLRTMVFRQRVVTVSVLTATATVAAALVAIMIYVVRSWYGDSIVYPTEPSAIRELVRHFGIAVYSAILAIPIGWALLASTPIWGFQSSQARRTAWR